MEIKVKPSSELIAFIESLADVTCAPQNIENVKKGSSKTELNLSDIQWLSRAIKMAESKHSLQRLLQNCDIIIPSLPPPPPRSPELEARVQRLKAEQEQREYDKMVTGIANSGKPQGVDNIAAEVRQINAQLLEVLGFVVSLGAAFAFGFFGLHYWIGPFEFGTRSLLGIFSAITVAIAELYFLVRTLDYDEAKLSQSSRSKLKTS